jgi:uncharacterized lipoprotein YmbA
MKMTKSIIILTLLSMLCACATTLPEPILRYYVLDESIVVSESQARARHLAIATISVSAYLEQPNLVLKESEHEVSVANYHRWADPLDSSIRRAISNDLMLLRQDILVVNECASCTKLKIWVDHFYPSTSGRISLSGSYVLYNADGTQQNYRFNLMGTQQRDGYAGAVTEMRALIKKLSAKIAVATDE